MCHFVTAVLPEAAPLQALDGIARLHGKQFAPLDNPSVHTQLRSAETYVLATAGVCDCGTGLGALGRAEARTRVNEHAEVRKLRRKGWTETKISRSLAMKEGRVLAQHARRTDDALADAQAWLDMLMDVFSSTQVPYVGLLLHWYNGALSSRIELQGRQVVPQGELTPRTLASMKEDVVYEFRAV